MKCLNCNTKTQNPKFCSRSCSASYNNKISPKRVRTKSCKKCKNLILSQRVFCDKCKINIYNDWDNITIEEIQCKAKYQRSAHIRENARRNFKKNVDKPSCLICGYTKHVEVCHIKPIDSFPSSTPVSVVNHIDNLVGLCPNHHWEFDNNQLELPISI